MELQYNKLVNLDIALKGTTRVVIRPGETYSFWHLVGRPTRRKGYLDGLILENGKIGRGVGGGLCQLGNLIYWMLLHTSLTVTERWRHGYDVFPDANRKVPFGSGATLSYNYIDLQFRNDTSQTYYLHIWKDAENLCGEILCSEAEPYLAEVFETDHMFVQQSWGGYLRCNKIWVRRKYSDGHEETKLISENQALMMYEPLLVAHT
jgi:vancomycin resistance protein VanW